MPTLSTSAAHAATALATGKLVSIPTETVYGLAANALSETSVQKIFAMKGRPAHNPLIIHVSDAAMAKEYVQWNALAQQLSEQFWPGALTLVLPKHDDSQIADAVSAGGNTLAVRCPAHPLAREVIAAFGKPLAAPSANRSGRISPTRATHVMEEFEDEDLLVLDGGACEIGLESTVVDCTGAEAKVLRPGSIVIPAQAEIQPSCSMDTGLRRRGALPSPGMLSSHYAPSLPVRLNVTHAQAGEAHLGFGDVQGDLNLSASGDVLEAAANLFDYLRKLDSDAYAAIAVAPIPQTAAGIAINDRLCRAAADRDAL